MKIKEKEIKTIEELKATKFVTLDMVNKEECKVEVIVYHEGKWLIWNCKTYKYERTDYETIINLAEEFLNKPTESTLIAGYF